MRENILSWNRNLVPFLMFTIHFECLYDHSCNHGQPRSPLGNNDNDIVMVILENVDIEKGVLQNSDIDKILYRLEFGISNMVICHWYLQIFKVGTGKWLIVHVLILFLKSRYFELKMNLNLLSAEICQFMDHRSWWWSSWGGGGRYW